MVQQMEKFDGQKKKAILLSNKSASNAPQLKFGNTPIRFSDSTKYPRDQIDGKLEFTGHTREVRNLLLYLSPALDGSG